MIEISVALVLVAVLARDGFRAWLKHKATQGLNSARVSEIERQMSALTVHTAEQADRMEKAVKLLSEDYKRKLQQFEVSTEDARKQIQAQVAGTLAQMPNTGRGFGR